MADDDWSAIDARRGTGKGVTTAPPPDDWSGVDARRGSGVATSEAPISTTVPGLQAQTGTVDTRRPGETPVTPQKPPVSLIGAIEQTVVPYMHYVGAEFGGGVKDAETGLAGFDALVSGDYDAAEARMREDQASKQNDQTIKSFKQNHQAVAALDLIGPAARALPGYFEIAKNFVAGYGAGALTGAGLGLAAAAPTGEAAAPATVLAGALAWGGMGGNAGIFKGAFTMAAGAEYMNLRRKGVQHDVARNAAVASGAVNGLLSVLKIPAIGQAGKAAMAGYVKSPAGRSLVANALKQGIKLAGINMGAAAFQEFTDQTIEHVVGEATHNEKLILTPQQSRERYFNSVTTAGKQGMVLGAAVHVTGHALASVKGELLPKRENSVNQGVRDLGTIKFGEGWNAKKQKLKQAEISPDDHIVDLTVQEDGTYAYSDKDATAVVPIGKAVDLAPQKQQARTQHTEYKTSATTAVENAVVQVLDAIQGPEALNKQTGQTLPVRSNPLVKYKRGKDMWSSPWNIMVGTVFQHSDSKHPAFEVMNVTKAVLSENANKNKFVDTMINHVTTVGAGRDSKYLDLMASGAEEKKRTQWEVGHPLHYTSDNQLMQVLGWMRDPDAALGLQTMGLGKADKTKIEKLLKPEQLVMVDKIHNFYKAYFERINAHNLVVTGAELESKQDYYGQLRRVGYSFAEDTARLLLEPRQQYYSNEPDSVQSRVKNALPLKPVDIFKNATRQIHQMEHWIAFTSPEGRLPSTVDRLSAVFNDGRIQEAVIHKFDQTYWDHFKEAYEDIVGVKEVGGKAIALVDGIRKGAGTAYPGGNPLQFLKQGTGVLFYMNHISPVALARGATEFFAEFPKSYEIMSDTDLLKQRKENTFLEVQEMLAQDGNRKYKHNMDLRDLQMLPIESSDILNIYLGGYAVYKDALRRGYSPEEALSLAEKISNETQSSATIDQRTPLERQGSLGKAAALFQKQSAQVAGIESVKFKRMVSNPTWENASDWFKSFLANQAANRAFELLAASSAVVAAAAVSNEEVEKALKDVMVKQLSMMVPGYSASPIGMAIEAIATNAANYVLSADKKSFALSHPALDTLNNLNKLAAKIGTETTGQDKHFDMDDVFALMHAYNRSIAVLPSTPWYLGGKGVALEQPTRMLEFLWHLGNPKQNKVSIPKESPVADEEENNGSN